MANRHRLFFALLPDERVRREILRAADFLKSVHAPCGTWTSPDRLHLTLLFLGDFPVLHTDRVQMAISAAKGIGMSRFEVSLDHATSFPGKSPPWVLHCAEPAAALQEFWSVLRAALSEGNFCFPPEPEFVPHVTLLRRADKALPATAIEPIAWPVNDYVLMHSETGQRNQYSTLHRWSLS